MDFGIAMLVVMAFGAVVTWLDDRETRSQRKRWADRVQEHARLEREARDRMIAAYWEGRK